MPDPTPTARHLWSAPDDNTKAICDADGQPVGFALSSASAVAIAWAHNTALATARAEGEAAGAEKAQCKATMWWEYDCDADDAPVDDPADIADRLEVGTVFRLQAAHALPDQFYVCEVDAENHSVARPADDAEIAAWKLGNESWKQKARELPKGVPHAQ